MDPGQQGSTIRGPGGGRAARDHLAALRESGGSYRAIAGNWCAGAALDDDHLDIPGYRPEHGWKSAAGTGPATDLPPPAHKNRDKATLAPQRRKTGRIA